MRRKLSRILVFVLTFLVSWSLVTKPAQASIWDWLKAQFQSEEASNNMTTSITQEGVSSEKHVTETSSNLLNVINLHVLGAPTSEDATASSMLRESVGPGLISVVNSGIVAMYEPPASSRTYMADLLQNAKIIPEAQAQGLGFSSLDPVLETWKSFRNIAYLFFVVLFLVIGFMIMFRTKIGQAAITVQQAIPSVIVALLAVTFSYAIAGLLIDLMYVVMYMLAALFDGGQEIIAGNFFTLVGLIITDFGENMSTAVESFMSGLLGQEFFLEGVLEWLSTLSATVIVGLAILIGTFKIFFELLKSYISIILQVVLAPIILMVGAIPGQNSFMSWIRNLASNLVMWPLVMICLLINRMLTQGTYTSGGFIPPFLIGAGQAETMPILVGIGILLVIPEIMKEAKKKMGVEEGIVGNLVGAATGRIKEAFPLGGRVGLGTSGAAIGGAMGGAGGVIRSLPKAFGQMTTKDIAGGFGTIGKGFLSGAGAGVKKGASTAVNAVMDIERSAGINQPDILNPVTHFIDTGETIFKSKPKTKGGVGEPISIGGGLATGKNRERATRKQEVEDFLDLANRALGKQDRIKNE